MTDEEMICGILNKNQSSFEALVDKYGGLIKSIVWTHLYCLAAYREECINDVLLSVWNNIDRFDSSKNTLKNWIGAVSKYKAIDYKRKYMRENINVPLDEALPDKKAFWDELQSDINSMLECLKPEDRQIFYRHYILGIKIPEMSKQSGKSESFYFSRLSRGRNKIRKHFGLGERKAKENEE